MLRGNLGCTREELLVLRSLRMPWAVQDYLEAIPLSGDRAYRSPRRVLRERRASCLEGALFAAAALWLHGERPLLLDLRSLPEDDDHVVALYRWHERWGAISKTNHAVLRYRDPVYRTVRELALSYFHEYFLDDGRKTLREYSRPFDLALPRYAGWVTTEEDLRWLADALDAAPHLPIAPSATHRMLRRADCIERAAGKLVAWPRTRRGS